MKERMLVCEIESVDLRGVASERMHSAEREKEPASQDHMIEISMIDPWIAELRMTVSLREIYDLMRDGMNAATGTIEREISMLNRK